MLLKFYQTLFPWSLTILYVLYVKRQKLLKVTQKFEESSHHCTVKLSLTYADDDDGHGELCTLKRQREKKISWSQNDSTEQLLLSSRTRWPMQTSENPPSVGTLLLFAGKTRPKLNRHPLATHYYVKFLSFTDGKNSTDFQKEDENITSSYWCHLISPLDLILFFCETGEQSRDF